MTSKSYRQPPKHTQFAQGKSGNPRGRPKGSRNLKSELRDELSERISITEGGVKRMVSKQRGLVKALYGRSIQGDMKAMAQFMKLIGAYLDDDAASPEAAVISAEDDLVLRQYEERIKRRIIAQQADEGI
jgi:hypothetical protein